jgi:hypothetical protein
MHDKLSNALPVNVFTTYLVTTRVSEKWQFF